MKKLLCLMLAGILLMCACGKKEVQPQNPDFGGVLSLFIYEDSTLNPLETKFQTNAQVLSAVAHRGLVTVSPNLEISCDLAQKYEFSQDKKSVTFTLLDVSFSDGAKITGNDVAKSLDTIKNNPENMYHVLFEFVSSYSASGNSITINLLNADTGVLAYMNFPVVKGSGQNVTGAGLYKTQELQKDRIIFTAVDNLSTNYETVRVIKYPKSETAYSGFSNNEIDAISTDYSNLANLQAKAETKSVEYVSDNFTFLGFNTRKEVLSDVNVRRAIASLFDKKDIASTLLAGYVEPVNSPFKPKTVYGDLYGGEYAADTKMFEQYLTNAGVDKGELSLSVLVNEESVAKTKTAEYICGKLNDAGIYSVVEAVNFDTYLQRIANGEYSLVVCETTVALNQDFGFLAESGKNSFGYSNQELDTLFNSFRTDTNMESKKETAKNIAKHFVDNLPVISLYYQKNVLVYDSDIEGEFNPMQTRVFGGLNNLKAKK